MIISNYLFFDLTISCIVWLLSTHKMTSYELFLSKLTTSWCKLFLLFEKIYLNIGKGVAYIEAIDMQKKYIKTIKFYFHVLNIKGQ